MRHKICPCEWGRVINKTEKPSLSIYATTSIWTPYIAMNYSKWSYWYTIRWRIWGPLMFCKFKNLIGQRVGIQPNLSWKHLIHDMEGRMSQLLVKQLHLIFSKYLYGAHCSYMILIVHNVATFVDPSKSNPLFWYLVD